MDTIKEAVNSLPVITRIILVPSIIVPIIIRLYLPLFYLLMFDYSAIVSKFHIWRLLTPVICTVPSFSFLVDLVYKYKFSVQLETSLFKDKPADYVFFLLLCILGYNLSAPFLGLASFFTCITFSILYLWSKFNADAQLSFFFGFRVQGVYFPFVLLAFNFITTGSYLNGLVGIAVAHLYYFAMYRHSNAPLLQTPKILLEYFPSATKSEPNPVRKFTGSGYRLGSS